MEGEEVGTSLIRDVICNVQQTVMGAFSICSHLIVVGIVQINSSCFWQVVILSIKSLYISTESHH